MLKYRDFNLYFLIIFLCLILGVGSFNFAIDPYGVTGLSISRLNELKPDKPEHEKLFKPIDVIRLKPKTIFLGNSRVNKALDPSHPALANSSPVYNFAINGADIYEVKLNLQHAIANQPKLSLVIIGIDLYMFNSKPINKNDVSSLGKTRIAAKDLVNITFSMDAFTSSIKTLITNTKVHFTNEYYVNGMYLLREGKETDRLNAFKNKLNEYLSWHREFQLANENLTNFQNIIELCKQNNIELKVFISPLHATQWETVRLSGNWLKFEQWQREIVKFTPIWDFSGYNTITTEPTSNEMKNYFESSHYKKPVGDLILNRMLHYHEELVPPDFGVLVTRSNIESHLKKIRDEREIWAKKNPNMVKLVEDENFKIISRSQK